MPSIFIPHAGEKLSYNERTFNDLKGIPFTVDNAWTEDGIDYHETIASYDPEDGDTFEDITRQVGRYFREMFMNGDCWDFALSLARNFDLKLGTVNNTPCPPDPGEERSIYGGIEHVFAILPDGRRLDVRGVFENDAEFLSYRVNSEPCWFDEIAPHEVIDACNDFARLGYIPPADFNSPETYEKAAIADELCELLYGEMLRTECVSSLAI
jgi:hypothetical protein